MHAGQGECRGTHPCEIDRDNEGLLFVCLLHILLCALALHRGASCRRSFRGVRLHICVGSGCARPRRYPRTAPRVTFELPFVFDRWLASKSLRRRRGLTYERRSPRLINPPCHSPPDSHLSRLTLPYRMFRVPDNSVGPIKCQSWSF